MNRKELEAYILNQYSTEPDYPWADMPRFAVFRHTGNRKWFALVMDVPRDKLGLSGTEPLDMVNFKCDPILIASLRGEPGIFPAYHMNKASWLTAALDGSVPRLYAHSGCHGLMRRGVQRAENPGCGAGASAGR